MPENIRTNGNEHMPCCSASKEGDHCPMSAKFDATMGDPKFRIILFCTGSLFILMGIAILVWPIVAAWLTAIISLLIGILVLTSASFLSKIGSSS